MNAIDGKEAKAEKERKIMECVNLYYFLKPASFYLLYLRLD